MTDRKLLEMAAKAAGIECLGDLGWKHSDGEIRAWWTPLTDDGDALRLAAKLNLDIRFSVCKSWVAAGNIFVGPEEKINDAPYAATRRAIVRAAAEIGKGMV